MFDYFILGQGICGSFLSYYLMQAGKRVLVIDQKKTGTASQVASGVINPVTGRRIVQTWMIETLLPFAQQAYSAIGKCINQNIVQETAVIDFHATPQMKLAFTERHQENAAYLSLTADENLLHHYFQFYFGAGSISPCLLVNLQSLLSNWRNYLQQHNSLLETNFDWNDFEIKNNEVRYGQWVAEKLICCDGAAGAVNPYFNQLPFALNKGEALVAEIKDLPANNIYKQGLSIVPWNEPGCFWIGSSYEWNYQDALPSEAFRKKTEQQLLHWLKLPFTVTEHLAALRPANIERRPFAGMHPAFPSIGILNGMGTKGCSLAPYFAKQLADHLADQARIDPLVTVDRFSGVLKRSFRQ